MTDQLTDSSGACPEHGDFCAGERCCCDDKHPGRQELQWRIRCSDSCGFVVTCADEEQARLLASGENTHGKTIVEARTVTYGDWLPGIDDAASFGDVG